MEMHFILSGSGDFITDFEDKHHVNAGDLVLIGKDVYHEEFIDNSVKMSGFCICFDIPIINDKANDFESIALQSMRDTRFLIKKQQSDIQLLFEMFAEEMQDQHIGFTESTKLILSLILLNISRICTKENTANFPIKPKTKKDLDKFICDEYFNRIFDMDDLKASDLADKLSVSVRHLNRLLNEIYGISFNNRINEMKLRFTKYQLITTSYTVEKIAENCGWSSTYLIQQFKKRYNLTPAVFRKNHRKDNYPVL